MAKKENKKNKHDIEEEDEFEDDVEDIEDLDDDVEELEEDIDDLDDDIDDLDDEESNNKKKPSKAKKANNAGKKKKSKAGLIIGIVAAVVVVVVAVGAVGYFFLGWFAKDSVIAGEHSRILEVNGYQQYISDVSTVSLKSSSTEDSIVSVNEMLTTTGLSMSKASDTTQIAEYIYNLAVTNYSNVKGTGWYCYTDSSVYAKDVDATLGIKFHFDNFNVGVRAAYAQASQESKDATLKAQGVSDYFSQTISGVTLLDIAGLPENLTGTLKGLFGYNIQECLYDGTFAFRRGSNGGAQFYGDTDYLGYKYLMGAYNSSFPTKLATKKTSEGGNDVGCFYIHDYDESTDQVAQALDYIDTPADETATREYAWSPLNANYSYAYKIDLYGNPYNYYCGDYGTGWAAYDFSKENLDEENTTVTYDAKTHVYTINMAVKSNKSNDACMFAKGSLTKDTKDYIQMQDPSYTLTTNTIEVYDNGLIKSWDRVETVASEDTAKLTILTGTCNGGGGTTNSTFQAFSYATEDYDPLSLAAKYWPELGTTICGKYAFDLTSYTNFENYVPKNVPSSVEAE